MAKDPAFLFYSSDFLTGTMMMSDEQVGKYIKLLCIQHQKGKLTEKEMLFICKEKDSDIFSKFVFSDGFYYNERLLSESEKRNKFCESRKNNRNKCDNENIHIYFIIDKNTNFVKIGSSVNPNRRIVELENENNDLCLLFYTEKTSQKLESELHEIYKDFNISYEWYDVFDKIHEIKKLLSQKNIIIIDNINTHMKTHMKTHMNKHMENENEDVIINKKGTKNFVKPTVDEITSYCRERKNNINPVKFFNHYESNGWMVGKSKMKNWKAAVRTWEGNNLDIQTPVVKRDNALNNLYR